MAKNFPLEIVTPERMVFSEPITGLVVPADKGYLGVLAGHAPLLCSLRPGEIKVSTETGDRFFSTAGGFMEVTPQKTILLSEAIEGAADIDVERAEKALARARERMSDPKPGTDRERLARALERAQNRVRIAKKRS